MLQRDGYEGFGKMGSRGGTRLARRRDEATGRHHELAQHRLVDWKHRLAQRPGGTGDTLAGAMIDRDVTAPRAALKPAQAAGLPPGTSPCAPRHSTIIHRVTDGDDLLMVPQSSGTSVAMIG
jgi:hypothetical protein